MLTYRPDASPKIQRLVTPLRLQRRRHLRSLKRRRIERQKEQKSEYDALLAKRIAEKKEKAAAVKASHKKYVSFRSLSRQFELTPRVRIGPLRKMPLRGTITYSMRFYVWSCPLCFFHLLSNHIHATYGELYRCTSVAVVYQGVALRSTPMQLQCILVLKCRRVL